MGQETAVGNAKEPRFKRAVAFISCDLSKAIEECFLGQTIRKRFVALGQAAQITANGYLMFTYQLAKIFRVFIDDGSSYPLLFNFAHVASKAYCGSLRPRR